MTERNLLIVLHVLGASVWVGGHLVLATTVLPRALREDAPQVIKNFEEAFERIGVPALLLQIATGLRLASLYAPPSRWFTLDDHAGRHIALKLGCLLATVALAAHARLSIIPRLAPGAPLRQLGAHIVLVTVLAVTFALLGVSLRFGGLFAG
jgi:putative copper export protein